MRYLARTKISWVKSRYLAESRRYSTMFWLTCRAQPFRSYRGGRNLSALSAVARGSLTRSLSRPFTSAVLPRRGCRLGPGTHKLTYIRGSSPRRANVERRTAAPRAPPQCATPTPSVSRPQVRSPYFHRFAPQITHRLRSMLLRISSTFMALMPGLSRSRSS